jgi:polysaccharide transporter, PST family
MISANAALLYAAQACRLAIPILVLPVVARRLDLDQFGALASAQALAYLVMIIPEYGFATLGPRRIALVRNAPEAAAAEARAIMRAKLLLCLPALAAAIIAGWALPTLLGDWRLIAIMALLGLTLGLNPGWYFQGLGQARIYALFEIGALTGFLALLLVVPFGPRAAWLVLALQTATLAAAVIAGHAVMLRMIGDAPRAKAALWPALREGFPLFLTKLASNGPGLGLLYIIGFALAPEAVAHYAAAERLLMGAANALWPVMQILMPEIAERRARDPAGADRLLHRGLGALVAIGCGLGAILFLFAPRIVAILFGAGFEPTIEALRVVAFALPCIAVTNALSNGVLAARGRDWLLTGIIIASALLSAGLALTLIGAADYGRVAPIRLGVEIALAAALIAVSFAIIRRER